MRNALISVFNKDGIVDFARSLTECGFDLIASGGTHKALTDAGLTATNTADLVGKAILGHKVVTLSREIHAGLLGDLETELDELESLGIAPIHLVCVDTYPLEEEIAKPGATLDSVKGQTDIGGPGMLRSGAKGNRIVICQFEDRQRVIDWLRADCPDHDEFVNQLAAKAEGYVASYCLVSARYRSKGETDGFIGTRIRQCKYGENGQQTPAALYSTGISDPLALDKFELIDGTEASYNNLCDVDRLLQTTTHIAAGFWVNYQEHPFIAVGAKHGNPCGAAVGSTPNEALRKMLSGDPRAIFGGLVLLNFPVGKDEALTLLHYSVNDGRRILDGVIASSFSDAAIELLGRKNGKCRMLSNPALSELDEDTLDRHPRFRYVRGGFLEQPNYTFVLDFQDPDLWKSQLLDEASADDLLLAWAVNCTSNSNTITLVRDGMLIGNGVGQQDRVTACRFAALRAKDSGHLTTGAVACSDSFFPFPDGPETLADVGIRHILATSGSVKDEEVKEACAKRNVGLYLLPDSKARGFFGH